MESTAAADRANRAGPPSVLHARRRALSHVAAAAAALLGLPLGATPPFTAGLSARKLSGGKVRSTVTAKVALPGLKWSGTLGTWDVPEGGSRKVSVQPPGVPAKFDLTLTSKPMQNMMQMLALMHAQVQYGGPWGPGYGYETSAVVA